MKLISTKDIAKKFNLSYQTVNYYTNLGMFPIRKRTGNRRLYDEGEIEDCVSKINQLRTMGYPLRLIVSHINGDDKALLQNKL